VLSVYAICVVFLSIVGLAFFVVYRSKPGKFKLSANVLKFVSFSIEVESQDQRQARELPPGSGGTGESRS
jgi:hypothetical protein